MSRPVMEVIQIAGFGCGLAGSVLAYAQYSRLVCIFGTALFMGVLGVQAMLAGTVPKGPGGPLVLFVIGLLVAALIPRVSRAEKLTANQLRAIGYVLSSLSILAQFVVDMVGIRFV